MYSMGLSLLLTFMKDNSCIHLISILRCLPFFLGSWLRFTPVLHLVYFPWLCIQWFKGGYTNICYNALDKHVLEGCGNCTTLLWEGNDVGSQKRITYSDMLKQTCQVKTIV